MGVAAAVGPHGEWSRSSGVAHSAHRLAQEVGGAPRRVGPALAPPTHQNVTVQTCGDLRPFRLVVDGWPSTEFALQADPVPSNVNSYIRTSPVPAATAKIG